MPNKFNLLRYAFIGVCVLSIGLSFCSRYLMTNVVEAHQKYVSIANEIEAFRHFEDSLAANENFRKKILDTLQNVHDLRNVKQNIGRELEQKLLDFEKQYPNRGMLLTSLKIVDGVKTVSNVLLVILGVTILIGWLRRRW